MSEVTVVKIREDKVSVYKGAVKAKGKKTVTINISYPWFNESERHYLDMMKLDNYTTKIYDKDISVDDIKKDLNISDVRILDMRNIKE